MDNKKPNEGHVITIDTPIEYVLKLAESCDRCGHCCSYSSAIFLDEDIVNASEFLGIPAEKFKEKCLEETEVFGKQVHRAKTAKVDKPFGPCMFYDKEEGCIIHDFKPLHCRAGKGCGEHGHSLSCWFSLNFLVSLDNPESIRQWAQFLISNQPIPGGSLEELVPDEEKRKKIMNHEILK